MKKVCLNKAWRLREAPLNWEKEALSRVLALEEDWMACELPCDVHTPLEVAGKIKDVVKADYCFDAEWTQNRSWWFVREFEGADVDLDADVIELTLESLDARADVFLNGEWLGAHISAHYPFHKGVKGRVRPGVNVLAVRMTSGLEAVTDQDLADINWAVCTEEGNGCPERGDRRRGWLRKPQYAVGWDWGPKAVTCGIVKNAYLKTYNKVAVRGAHLATVEAREGASKLRLSVEVDQLHVYATRDCDVRVDISLDGEVQTFERKDVLLTSGLNYVDMDIALEGARLWWPAGFGEQPLYEVAITVTCQDAVEEYPAFRYGVRKIELDVSRTSEKARNFFLVVNGVRVFCKGGDWIPADSIYARITGEKYDTLVREAREANFNMLRIWGGGIYERDEYYDACDRYGILLWHDFMFGCAACPDHLDWFQREVAAELDYQTKRLRNRASLALWCGNNENHWLYNPVDSPNWNLDMSYERQYGLFTANEQAKIALRNNCPEIPYWNSSPYGGDLPNDDLIGDVHHWRACMMNEEMAKRIEPREYDKVMGRFVSEYGYPGPCAIESIREYFDGQPIDRGGKVWDLHNNTFEKHTVAAGIEKHYLDGALELNLEDYLLYAGLVQSLMLEYSLEAMRFKDFCGGGLFWMYNDTWGEVGWTIVDYYLRRKISFYGVKRAFAPVKLTLRMEGGKARLQGLNDTAEALTLKVKIGYMPFDGSRGLVREETLTLAPHSRAYLGDYELPEADYTRGAFVALPACACCAPAILRQYDMRNLRYVGARPEVLDCAVEGDRLILTLTAKAFVHGVHVKESYVMSDNYFDLAPGQIKRVVIEGARECPTWHTIK